MSAVPNETRKGFCRALSPAKSLTTLRVAKMAGRTLMRKWREDGSRSSSSMHATMATTSYYYYYSHPILSPLPLNDGNDPHPRQQSTTSISVGKRISRCLPFVSFSSSRVVAKVHRHRAERDVPQIQNITTSRHQSSMHIVNSHHPTQGGRRKVIASNASFALS